jgi:hypothetical protein
MIARSFLSEWSGLLLICLMALCLAVAMHDDRASSASERVIAPTRNRRDWQRRLPLDATTPAEARGFSSL